MFESIKLRVMKGRKLKPFAVVKVLQEHEDKLKSIAGIDTTEIQDITSLQTVVGNENSGLVKDVTGLKTTVGDANTDNTLVKDVATLKTGKANSNHSHTLSSISDLETVSVVITYEDDSTETVLLVKQTSS